MAMTINAYYAKEGRNAPKASLAQQHQEIIQKIESRKTKEDLKQMQQELNELYYPKSVFDSKISREALQELITESYNFLQEDSTYSKNRDISSNISFDDADTYIDVTQLVQGLPSFNKIGNTYKNTTKVRISTIDRYIKELNMNLELITSAANKGIKEYKSMKRDLLKKMSEYEAYVNRLCEDTDLVNNGKYSRYFYIAADGKKKNDLAKYRKEIWQKLANWHDLLETLQGSVNYASTNEKAAIGESMVAVYGALKNNVAVAGSEQLKNYFSKSLIATKRTQSSDNGLLKLSVNVDDILNTGSNKNLGKIESFTINGLEIKVSQNYDVTSNRQVKADVQITGDIRASVKNWSSPALNGDFNNLRGFNATSLLYAITRTFGTNSLIDYMYVVQDNQFKPSSEGANALAVAHGIAKEAIIVDTVLGLSQSQFGTDANIAIINDRQSQKIIVLDIAEMVSQTLQNVKNYFEVKGYDEDQITKTAYDYLRRFRQMRIYGKGTSRMYQACMYSYLNSIKLEATLTSQALKEFW